MEFNYGRIRIGKWLHGEDGGLNVLQMTWMDGDVVVPENGVTTNLKRLVRGPVVESAMVRATTQEVAPKGREQREMKVLAMKVLAKKVLIHKVIATKVLANKVLIHKFIATKVLANKVLIHKVLSNMVIGKEVGILG